MDVPKTYLGQQHVVRVCSVHPPSYVDPIACYALIISRSKSTYYFPFRFRLPSELEPEVDLRASAAAPWPPEANRTALRTLTTSPEPPVPSRFTFFNDEPPDTPFPICLMRARFAFLSVSTGFSIGSNWGRGQKKVVSTHRG